MVAAMVETTEVGRKLPALHVALLPTAVAALETLPQALLPVVA